MSPQAGLSASTVTAGGSSRPTLRGFWKCWSKRSECTHPVLSRLVAASLRRVNVSSRIFTDPELQNLSEVHPMSRYSFVLSALGLAASCVFAQETGDSRTDRILRREREFVRIRAYPATAIPAGARA